jgi:hypothetical protein
MPRAAMRPNVTKRPGNRNYCNGRRAEYEARDLLISEGFEVVRAAGSKGAADLVGVRKVGSTWGYGGSVGGFELLAPVLDVVWVSVKRGAGRADKAQRERLAALPGRREIWTRVRGGGFHREVV